MSRTYRTVPVWQVDEHPFEWWRCGPRAKEGRVARINRKARDSDTRGRYTPYMWFDDKFDFLLRLRREGPPDPDFEAVK